VQGLGRFEQRDRLEAEPLSYHQQVRAAFLTMAEEDPERYLLLDARDDVDVIAAAILARVMADLGAADAGATG
jgi:dTMP kinase